MKNKDWTGNDKAVYATLGASNHVSSERQHEDYYATDPRAAEMLLDIVPLDKEIPIWECASGENHLADIFKAHGYQVRTSDIVQRTDTTEVVDFLSDDVTEWNGHIITNPPYSQAKEFIIKAMDVVQPGNLVIMFLKIQFLEGKARRPLFAQYPPREVWVSSSRIACAKNGDFASMDSSAVAYAWYVWEKGYKGTTTLKWFN